MAVLNTDRQSLKISDPDSAGGRLIVLNRPDKANALNAGLVEAIHEALDTAIMERKRALIFTGAGKNFCAGFDFTDHENATTAELVQRFVRIEALLQRLRRAPFVTISLIQGPAYGAGADLAAACAFRIGTSASRFRFPGFQFGVALGTRRLVRIIGMQQARDILLRNRMVDAADALRIGLLTECVRPERLQDAATGLLNEIKSLSDEAVGDILRITGEDTDERDLADLVHSLSREGLHQRINTYRTRLM